jgi:DNA-binding MarR family transcriptional regulator
MRTHALALTAVVALSAAGCVTRSHEENAARRSTWPTDAFGAQAAASRSDAHWPTVKGDILQGTSPEDLAKIRATVSQPLTEALGKP